MAETPPLANTHEPGGPTFEKIVVCAAVLLIILLAFAWFFIRHASHKLLPQQQARPITLILR